MGSPTGFALGLLDAREGSRESEGLGGVGFEFGGPTGTMREPNSTPIVTSWWGENLPSQRRIVREDLPEMLVSGRELISWDLQAGIVSRSYAMRAVR